MPSVTDLPRQLPEEDRRWWGPIYSPFNFPSSSSEPVYWGPMFSPFPVTPPTIFGGTGPTWGPIAGPVPSPVPPFGTITTPPTQEKPPMPFPLLPGRIPTGQDLLGRAIGFGADIARRFLPGQTQTSVGFPGTGMPTIVFPERMAGRVTQQGCGCVVEKSYPAGTRKIKGKAVFGPDGSFLGCTPAPRRMNPMNARAALRAARRLRSVSKFSARIDKAIRRACRSKGRSGRMGTKKRTCK